MFIRRLRIVLLACTALAWAGLAAAQDGQARSFPWGIVLAAGAFIAAAGWFMRSRTAGRGAPQAGHGQQPGDAAQRPDGPVPAQPGVGGNLMGGLATGLAVGAGAFAAQEIGRRMLGEQHLQHGPDATAGGAHAAGSAADSQLARDAGLGSVGRSGDAFAAPDDFGVDGTASWDDGGGDGGWDS